jgi:hypothetical protein
MLLDPIITKTVVVFIVLALYAFALIQRQVSRYIIILGVLYFAIGAPLGFDTIFYRNAFKTGRIIEYGFLWEAGYEFANLIDCWWVMYPIVYVILLHSFVKLSETTNWPSLVFAALVTMPGIGFNYLSILRQALASAFIIYVYLGLSGGRIKQLTWTSVLAYLAHPSAIMPLPIIAISQSKFLSIGRRILLATIIIPTCAMLLLDGRFLGSQVVRFQYLIDNFLRSDTRIYDDNGVKLFFIWCTILLLPLITLLIVNKRVGQVAFCLSIIIYLALYGFLVTISGQAVRIAWYGLPMLIALAINMIGIEKSQYHSKVIGFVMTGLCLISSVYVVLIAPEHFWSGVINGEVNELNLE